MPRVTLTALAALGSYGIVGVNSVDLPMVAADVSDKNQVVATCNQLVFAHNTGGSAYTITISSTNDPFNRTGDIAAYSIGAGEYALFGPFELDGWVQTDGKLYLEAENAAVKLGIINLPG